MFFLSLMLVYVKCSTAQEQPSSALIC